VHHHQSHPLSDSRKPVWVRVLGVLACAYLVVNGMPGWSKAHATLKEVIQRYNQHLPEEKQQFIGSHNHEYLQTWWNHFLETGSVADAGRAGRPRKVKDEHAREAAQIIKDGKEITHVEKGQTVRHRVHYTSIGEAILESPRLQEICNTYDLDGEQLLHAMHHAGPSLVRRKLFFKHAFTHTQRTESQNGVCCMVLGGSTGLGQPAEQHHLH